MMNLNIDQATDHIFDCFSRRERSLGTIDHDREYLNQHFIEYYHSAHDQVDDTFENVVNKSGDVSHIGYDILLDHFDYTYPEFNRVFGGNNYWKIERLQILNNYWKNVYLQYALNFWHDLKTFGEDSAE